MDRRLFIHIGLHKTGTTSIQLALTKSRAALAAAGWLYPAAGTPEWAPFGQHMLAWSLMLRPGYLPLVHGRRPTFEEDQRSDLWRTLQQEVHQSQASNVILSSEEFDTFSRDEVSRLADRLQPLAAQSSVVVFLRNKADFIESAYRTSVLHSGYTGSISEFAQNQRSRLDYPAMLRDWADVFGVDALEIIDYDTPSVAKDSVDTFFECLGIDASLVNPSARERYNESVPAFLCEALRFMRMKGVAADDMARVTRQVQQLRFPRGSYKDFALLPAELRVSLDSSFAADVQTLRDDPELSAKLPGTLGTPKHAGSPFIIRHVVDAMLATFAELPKGCPHREQNGQPAA